MIRCNETEQIQNAINSGREHGMISFQQCQRDLVGQGLMREPSLL
jgi:Tfp pilus assembly pilus retraction ATPase PilT